eukprot:jgi/Chrzof1/6078/Cz17g08040.t1
MSHRGLLADTLNSLDTSAMPKSAGVKGTTWGPIPPVTWNGNTTINITAVNPDTAAFPRDAALSTDGSVVYNPLSVTAQANESRPYQAVKSNYTVFVDIAAPARQFTVPQLFPAPAGGPLLGFALQNTANSIKGPALARSRLSAVNAASGSVDARATTTARAFPGSLTGIEAAVTDVHAESNSRTPNDLTLAVGRADGQASKGLTAGFVTGSAVAPNSNAQVYLRGRARSFDGYMTGGIATAGTRALVIAGGTRGFDDLFSEPGEFPAAAVRTDTQARANLGAANAGGYVNARAKGNVISRATVTSRTYAGESATGLINIGVGGDPGAGRVTIPGAVIGARNSTLAIEPRTVDYNSTADESMNVTDAEGRVITPRSTPATGSGRAWTMSTGDGVAATTGVGSALSGAVMISIAPGSSGDAFIGDYDQEADTTDNEVIARTRGRGTANGGLVNFAFSRNGASRIVGDTISSSVSGLATGAAVGLANAWQDASNTLTSTTSTTEYDAWNAAAGLSQGTGRVANTIAGTAKTGTGNAVAGTLANSIIGQDTSAVGSAEATTKVGQAAGLAASQAIGGVTSASQGSAKATTATGNALGLGSAISGSAFTARAVGTTSAETADGYAVSAGLGGSLAADAQGNSASSATTAAGNALSSSFGLGFGALNGDATSVSAASSGIGGAGVQSLGASTGLINARTRSSGTAKTDDGNAQAVITSVAVGGGLADSGAQSTAATTTGDAAASADSFGISAVHGVATSNAKSSTGNKAKKSTANANSLATGFIGEASAKASANSPNNPGKAVANAVCLGVICKVDNGGQAKVAIGPAQAVTGGFAVTAPHKVVIDVNNAAQAAAAVQKALGSGSKTTMPAMPGMPAMAMPSMPKTGAATADPLSQFVSGLATAAQKMGH